ncbi:hypothetical protein GCM10010521_36860 [Streptomyces rameus]|uniref:Uncharacterized protein n=1 Tax=Streptomyces rameus TaxID=68261 RepID=A0ABP6NF65_9ACTN
MPETGVPEGERRGAAWGAAVRGRRGIGAVSARDRFRAGDDRTGQAFFQSPQPVVLK